MPEPTPADGTRWRGFAHKDLYQMLHDGPGATASAEPSRRWGEIAATLTEIGQDLKTALDAKGAGWTGPAAGAARNRLLTAVGWATATGTAAATMRTSVEDQAGHIAKARAEMPKPAEVPATQPDPAVAPAVQVLETQTDAEPAEAAASSAEERAVEVMTAYETSTSTTTSALPTFTRPEQLVPSTSVRDGIGGMLGGLGLTTAAGLVGSGRRDHDDRHEGRGSGRGGGHHGTSGAAAAWDGGPRRQPSAPVMGPGKMTGASLDPFFAAPGRGGGSGDSRESSPRRGNVVGANPSSSGSAGSGGSGGVPGPKAGLGGGALPNELQAAQQAAAAQHAAGAHGAGAPIAPTAGAPAGAQEKMAMRRFGMEAIGSSQWFADQEEPVPGQSDKKRRFDLRESREVTESVSILDEEHKLPPNVIGE